MLQSSTEAKLLRCIGLHAYPTGVAARSEGQQTKQKSTTNDNRAIKLNDRSSEFYQKFTLIYTYTRIKTKINHYIFLH